MKKILFTIVLSAMFSFTPSICLAQEKVELGCAIVDPRKEPIRRIPANIPTVYIYGHELSFVNLWGGAVVEVLQGEEVVFTSYAPAGSSIVELPSTLTGEYEIRLLTDSNFYYYGYICF